MTLSIRDLDVSIADLGDLGLAVRVRQRVRVDDEHRLLYGPSSSCPLSLTGGDVARALERAIESLEWTLADPARGAEVMGTGS